MRKQRSFEEAHMTRLNLGELRDAPNPSDATKRPTSAR